MVLPDCRGPFRLTTGKYPVSSNNCFSNIRGIITQRYKFALILQICTCGFGFGFGLLLLGGLRTSVSCGLGVCFCLSSSCLAVCLYSHQTAGGPKRPERLAIRTQTCKDRGFTPKTVNTPCFTFTFLVSTSPQIPGSPSRSSSNCRRRT